MKAKIKVVHVFGILNRGGAETMLMNIYRNIDRERIQFDFVVHGDEKGIFEDEITELGGNIYRIPKYKVLNHIEYKKEWENLIKTHDFDIIHSHISSVASILLKIAKKFNIVTISHSHNTSVDKNFKGFVKSKLQHRIVNHADYLYACGEEAGKWLFGPTTEFSVIPNTIDTSNYMFDNDERNNNRKKMKIENKVVYTSVARFSLQKNHDFLIDIFFEIQKRQSNAVLLLAGKGDLKEKIESKVLALGISEKVHFLGVVNEISSLLFASDCFLMPSLYEGLPVSLVEAQASGLPVILSDTITRETDFTGLLRYFSLDSPAEEWAEFIINEHFTDVDRIYSNELVIKAGYDSINASKRMLVRYENMINRA